MSEANAPFNPPDDQAQAAAADSGWPVESTVLKGDGPVPDQELAQIFEHLSQQGELANAFDINQIFDASDLEDLTEDLTEVPQAANRSSITTWLQEPIGEAQPPATPANSPQTVSLPEANLADAGLSQSVPETPNLADLVSLIQELNQCNGLLMERVSQLEEALEHSQTALQDEVGRAQSSDSEQDWATVQEQVTNLFNQLEFAHQTNQRQQILIETLTGQLENSQERVAELEREAAFVQQRYNEQSQLLAKSDHTSRDLQSRLQRQQRYTLQFKAALEKSLEVPTPQYEVGLSLESAVEAPPVSEVLFLPKAKQIQPWSAQTHASKAQPLSKSPWMKFQNQPLGVGSEASSSDHSPLVESVQAEGSASAHQLNLPSFGLPLPPLAPESPSAQPAAPAGAAPDSAAPNFDAFDAAVSDPALKQQLDEAVKPLADLLAEALLGEAQSQSKTQPHQPSIQPESPSQSAWSGSAVARSDGQSNSASLASADETTADDLLASVMADAEDALWQDLARLIDVSAEDVVKASLSGDLAAFETLDFTSLQAVNEPQIASPAAASPSQAAQPDPEPSAAVTVAPLLRRLSQAQAAAQQEEAEQPELNDDAEVAGLTTSSWPSPVVYPLRPVKRRHSLAMVDLPSFPKS